MMPSLVRMTPDPLCDARSAAATGAGATALVFATTACFSVGLAFSILTILTTALAVWVAIFSTESSSRTTTCWVLLMTVVVSVAFLNKPMRLKAGLALSWGRA